MCVPVRYGVLLVSVYSSQLCAGKLRGEIPEEAMVLQSYLQACDVAKELLANQNEGFDSIETLEQICCGCGGPHANRCVACGRDWHSTFQNGFIAGESSKESKSHSSHKRRKLQEVPEVPQAQEHASDSEESQGDPDHAALFCQLHKFLHAEHTESQLKPGIDAFARRINEDASACALCVWCLMFTDCSVL